ncbi:hypothetical protein ACLKA7_003652 [Drosophila subpalustris]
MSNVKEFLLHRFQIPAAVARKSVAALNDLYLPFPARVKSHVAHEYRHNSCNSTTNMQQQLATVQRAAPTPKLPVMRASHKCLPPRLRDELLDTPPVATSSCHVQLHK